MNWSVRPDWTDLISRTKSLYNYNNNNNSIVTLVCTGA